jgi:gliding motility-associated-like protein
LKVDFNVIHPDIQYEFSWLIEGQAFQDMNPTWTFDEPGNYEIILNVKNENGCIAPPVKITEIVHPLPEASFTNSPEITMIYEPLIEFENHSSDAVFYQWDFGDGSSDDFIEGNHVYSETGTFNISLIVVTRFGCMDTAYGKVIIEDGFSFYVPNAVTPNDDGVNDFFQGYGTYLISYDMSIYDRWGVLIYHTTEYDKPWDCKIHSVVQNDTYVYRIVVSDSKKNSHVYVGSVTVVQ